MPAEDLTGREFGGWTVTGPGGRDRHGRALWWCRCRCGAVRRSLAGSLRRPAATGCRSCVNAARVRDLSGREFGGWTVLRRSGSAADGSALWLCRCKCGAERAVKGRYLTSLRSTRCRPCGSRDWQAARREEAMKLRAAGLTLAEIGRELGVSKQRAHQLLSTPAPATATLAAFDEEFRREGGADA